MLSLLASVAGMGGPRGYGSGILCEQICAKSCVGSCVGNCVEQIAGGPKQERLFLRGNLRVFLRVSLRGKNALDL